MGRDDEDFTVTEGSYWDEGRASRYDDGGATMDAEYAGTLGDGECLYCEQFLDECECED